MNKVILVGRTTKDVEVRTTLNRTPVASFTIAVENRFTSKDSKNTAEFINCVAWSNTAEFMEKYVRKGSLISLEGRIQTRSYDNKDGNKVYTTEVVVENLRMLGSAASSRQDREEYGMTDNNIESYDSNMDMNPDYEISDDDLPF